jgi:hypothetical protein
MLSHGAELRPRLWLTLKLRVYLNGFWSHGIRPKTRKDSQKVAGRKYEVPAFTMPALTMISHYAKRAIR